MSINKRINKKNNRKKTLIVISIVLIILIAILNISTNENIFVEASENNRNITNIPDLCTGDHTGKNELTIDDFTISADGNKLYLNGVDGQAGEDYYLAQDFIYESSGNIPPSIIIGKDFNENDINLGEITICTNGYNIKLIDAETDGYREIGTIENYANLSIDDCKQTTQIYSRIDIKENASFKLYGAKIGSQTIGQEYNLDYQDSAVKVANSAEFIMYGGEIIYGNKDQSYEEYSGIGISSNSIVSLYEGYIHNTNIGIRIDGDNNILNIEKTINVNNNITGIKVLGNSNYININGGVLSENGVLDESLYYGGSLENHEETTGAISVKGYFDNIITMNDGLIQNNKSTVGGAISIIDVSDSNQFILNGGTIESNTAYFGGAIIVRGGSTGDGISNMIMTGGTITNNHSINYGGGGAIMVASGAELEMTGGTISNNTSVDYGGGISVVGGEFRMSDGSIVNNTATGNVPPIPEIGVGIGAGGGIYVGGGEYTGNYGEIYIFGGNIEGNIAGSETSIGLGGGIFISPYVDTFGYGDTYDAKFEGGRMFVENNPQIINNSSKIVGVPVNIPSNVYLAPDKTIMVTGELISTAKIGVTTEEKPTKTTDVLIAEGITSITHEYPDYVANESYPVTSEDEKAFFADESQYSKLYNPIENRVYLTEITYTVTFEENADGNYEIEVPDIKDIAPGSKIFPPEIKRDGYAFEGWHKDKELTEVFDFENETINQDITLYAKWQKLYVVVFETNGGSQVDALSPRYPGSKIQESEIQVTTREGYKFTGWYKDNELRTLFDFENDTIDSDYTILYAGWEKIVYTVRFEENGGSQVSDINDINPGSKIEEPSTLREGYKFTGWYKDQTLTQKFNFENEIINENMILYAGWEEALYTVIFEENGGTEVSDISNIVYDSKIQEPDITKGRYEFLGWYKESTFINKFDFNVDTIKENITLYAYWGDEKYQVKFEENGGTDVEDLGELDYESQIKEPNIEREGYQFDGWYKDEELTILFDFENEKITENTVIYAGWTPNLHTVIFEENGGTEVEDLVDVEFDSFLIEPEITKGRYEFLGWYEDEALTDKFDFETEKVNGDMILYANWGKELFIVTFEENGGTEVEDLFKVRDGDLIKEPSTVREGYELDGWYKEKTFENRFDFETEIITSDITLYANWKAITIPKEDPDEPSAPKFPMTGEAENLVIEYETNEGINTVKVSVAEETKEWSTANMLFIIIGFISIIINYVKNSKNRVDRDMSKIEKIIMSIIGIGLITLFVLTQNITGNMVFIDEYSIVFGIIVLIQIGYTFYIKNMKHI